jgi:hypothetical protein
MNTTFTKFGSMKFGPKRLSMRRKSGQALAEGAAFLVILMMVVTGCLMTLLNLSVVMSEQQKIQVAATQAAQYIMGRRYWLGAMRTDYNEEQTANAARAVADGVLEALGLPASSSFSATDMPVQNGITVTTVTLGVSGLPLLNGARLPIALSASSASTTSQDITQGWRAVSIQCADPNNPQDQTQWRTAVVPCYNYLLGSTTSQNSPVTYSKVMGPSVMGSVTVVRTDSGPCAISGTPTNTW